MPIKKDGTGKRWVEMELLVPGTPEQVWQAVATGQGNAAWFTKGDIEPRVGGMFSLDFGGGVVTTGEVTAWDPPSTFAYVERDWSPGAPPVATEITITSRADGQCVLRMVHSLFTSSDDWDDQVEGFEKGWPGFFEVLRVYLAQFAGGAAASFMAIVPTNVDAVAAWKRLGAALGVGGANVGERCAISAGPEPWSGVVEHVHQDSQQRWIILRTEAPQAGVALIGALGAAVNSGDVQVKLGPEDTAKVSLCRYFYGENAAALAADSETRWREWLTETFTAETAVGTRHPATP